MTVHFSDEVSQLGALQSLLKEERSQIRETFSSQRRLSVYRQQISLQNAWRIKRTVGNLEAVEKLTEIALAEDKQANYVFYVLCSCKVTVLLPLPLGTASIERSYFTVRQSSVRHTMNAAAWPYKHPNADICRSVSRYWRRTISLRGVEFINSAFSHWLSKPRRGLFNLILKQTTTSNVRQNKIQLNFSNPIFYCLRVLSWLYTSCQDHYTG